MITSACDLSRRRIVSAEERRQVREAAARSAAAAGQRRFATMAAPAMQQMGEQPARDYQGRVLPTRRAAGQAGRVR